MKVKMKRCINCNTLLSNSSKVCSKCGSKEIEKGSYTDESDKELNKPNNYFQCPTCSAPVTIKNGHGECYLCGDEILVYNNGASTIIDSAFQQLIEENMKNKKDRLR